MSTTSSKRFGEGWSMQDKGLTFYYLAFFFLRGLCRRLFMGAVKATNAKEIRVPFMLRFLK